MPHPVPVRRTALLTALALACGPVAPITTYTAPAREYRGQAPGGPVFPCEELRATAARMRSGLSSQDQAIRRTQEQLDAARKGVHESVEEAQISALKAATNLASHQLTMARQLENSLENAQGFSPLARQKLYETFEKFKTRAESIEKLSNSLASGANLGAALRDNQLSFGDAIKELEASGISDEGATRLASLFAGPLGLMAVENAIVMRDVIYAGWGLYNNYTEADAAQRNLDTMREARTKIDDRLYEINDILTKEPSCASPPKPPQDLIMTQPPAPDPPPYTPVPPAKPAPAPAPAQKHGSGGQAVAGILLGGAAAAALYGYAKNKYGPNNNCVAPIADIPALCSPRTSACSQALNDQVAYCQCMGYATFDAAAGTCR